MVNRIRYIALLLLVSTALHAQTADEYIAKYIAAVGGPDKMKAVTSLKRTGKFIGGGGFEAVFAQENKRPAFVRQEFTIQGLTGVNAYDGKRGWKIEPWGGKKDAEDLGEDELKSIVEESDFDGPLVDYKAKGNKVEYLGIEDVDGTEAHKLKVTRQNGDVDTIWLDPDYFLQIRVLEQHRIRGTEMEQESDFGDYELVEGVYIPFSIETGEKGSTEKGQKFTVSKVELNVPADDAQFRFPTAAAPAK